MRKHLGTSLLAAALFGLASGFPAQAADIATLEDRLPPAPAEAAQPVYVWTGAYAGAFVGYNTTNFNQSGGASFDADGFVGGVYSGYNFQDGPLVYGLEADFGGSGVDGNGYNAAAGAQTGAEENVFGSLRARVGVAADPFLVFATGGAAVSNNKLTLGSASDTKTSTGYTVGGGIDAKITDNVSARLEYRYSDYGKETYDLGNTSVSSGFDEHSIRAGVALKF
ncbi:outer membrane protein [Aurantimonas sp. VKM B-3413]|uniref:outer membrane protein n=1 Tax=Aurantimonas sp. VKM B-3413 TaxID=2779401 RepID=UPI001E5E31EB|nr:outer membrane protein [Aurantimonas sp. VKM B-3413]MCB8836604.1 porin family protein [Aurantimonas sp. VKM B-3413]